MNFEHFKNSLSDALPPQSLSIPLQALWWDGKGNWNRGHDVLQMDDGTASAWVHAYLHRKEGDLSNSRYWYHRAARPQATGSLDSEWQDIAKALLAELT